MSVSWSIALASALVVIALLIANSASVATLAHTDSSVHPVATDDELKSMQTVNITHSTLSRAMQREPGRLASWAEPSSSLHLRFHDQRAIDEFFDRQDMHEWKDVYHRLPTDRAKADMWRYAHMWVNGGWYADADTTLHASHESLPSLNTNSPMYVTRYDENTLATHIIGAPPRHPVALRAMELIRERIDVRDRGQYHDESFLERLTGLQCFSDASREYISSEAMVVDNSLTSSGARAFGCVSHAFDGDRADGWRAEARARARGYDSSDDPSFGAVS